MMGISIVEECSWGSPTSPADFGSIEVAEEAVLGDASIMETRALYNLLKMNYGICGGRDLGKTKNLQ